MPNSSHGRALHWWEKFSYSVGHVLNDLCASMWFTYLLLFFHFVLEFNSTLAGIVLLIGQVADALSTPFVGIESDRTDNFWMCRYGRRKTWHLIGTFCTLLSFPFIFLPCVSCSNSSQIAQLVYYGAFVCIFQFGWAAVQVSHLSLIPDLTDDESERTELTAFRYAFTVLSNIFVYLVTWLVLGISRSGTVQKTILPSDDEVFRNVALVSLSIGAILTLVFHIGVREQHNTTEIADRGSTVETRKMVVSDWFRLPGFYQNGVIYMSTRLFVNISQIFISLYIQDSLSLEEKNIAVVPLVMFVAGFLSSFFMKIFNKKVGRKVAYFAGALTGIGACIWIALGQGEQYKNYEIYAVAALLGIGGSTMLITSLALTADLIGDHVEGGAFVYGAMSFTDKLSNGIAVLVIQYFYPHGPTCHMYYRNVLAYVCGCAAILGSLGLLHLKIKTNDSSHDIPDETSSLLTGASGTTNHSHINNDIGAINNKNTNSIPVIL